jgi:ABC-2 type transport system permease protein
MTFHVPAPAHGTERGGVDETSHVVTRDAALSEQDLEADVGVRPRVARVVSSDVGLRHRLIEIWSSRGLLQNLVRTEISVRYKNSFLGIIWSMISPAMTLAIYFVVFQSISKNGIPNFVIFLFSGFLVWNMFQLAVVTATGVVVNNAGLVKKISFPREILALASIGSASVFFFFQAIVLVIFMVALRCQPDWSYLPLLPLAFVALICWSIALAIFLSAINVYLRDTQHLVEVLFTAWFWACPIVYAYQPLAQKLAAHHLSWIYFFNPMVPIVLTYQRVIYGRIVVINTVTKLPSQILPARSYLWYTTTNLAVLAAAIGLIGGALIVFGRLEGNFAEEL